MLEPPTELELPHRQRAAVPGVPQDAEPLGTMPRRPDPPGHRCGLLAASALLHLAALAALWFGAAKSPLDVDSAPLGVVFYPAPGAEVPAATAAPRTAAERQADQARQAMLDHLVQPTTMPDGPDSLKGAAADPGPPPDVPWIQRPDPSLPPWAANPAPEPAENPGLPADAGGDVTPPLVREETRTLPTYPEDAQRAGLEGTVVIKATIDEQGRSRDLVILRGLSPTLDQAALDAVRHWRFRPATRQGVPVRVFYVLSVNFKL
jgi:TonB family protein